MTRPASHRTQSHPRCCGTCKHSAWPESKEHLLCFFGDTVEIIPSSLREWWSDVIFDGTSVGLLDGDEYDKVWGDRVVEDTDVCDEWESE